MTVFRTATLRKFFCNACRCERVKFTLEQAKITIHVLDVEIKINMDIFDT